MEWGGGGRNGANRSIFQVQWNVKKGQSYQTTVEMKRYCQELFMYEV